MSSSCLALVPSPPAGNRKYKPSPWSDEQIGHAYAAQRQGSREALKAVSRTLGWPPWAVARRGAELGITRAKERPWSVDEERILETYGHLTGSAVQRHLARAGFRRTRAAIALKTNRLRIKSNLDGYSACSLAAAFGVDTHKILAWIHRGLLKASRRGTLRTQRQGGDTWWIENREVRRFILGSPEEIDLARVEKIWFLDVVTQGKICRS